MSWEKSGKPGDQALCGNLSGADAPRERTTRLPRPLLAPQYEAAAARPGGTKCAHYPDSGALRTLPAVWVSQDVCPPEGRPVGCESRNGASSPETRGTPSRQESTQAAPCRDEYEYANPGRVSQPCLELRFVHDETSDGRRLKCLTVLDEYTREGLTIYCARSITAQDVVHVLQRLFAQRGTPGYVTSDNGPEFMAPQVTTWLREPHVETHVIDPGSPWQKGQNERFNGVFRDGCLDRWLFASVQEARRIINNWLEEYNHERPHGALEGLTPSAFAAQCGCPSLEKAARVALTLKLVALFWA
jgi:transposase InsO family protein